MKGDFSRQTFDPTRHYDAVLMQQGRVQVDADWNEEGAIARYRRDTETGDVIGPRGTPRDGSGFAAGLSGDAQDLTLGPGRMYVDGILCELGAAASYRSQPDFDPPAGPPADGFALLYLDVWQRLATALDDPHIRETALGGPDTAARLQTVWQAKLAPWAGPGAPQCGDFGPGWTPVPPPDGLLTASTADPGAGTSGPCVLPPTAGYQRLENQLYRVEIQQGGPLGTATFKWSRDNGSVVTAILAISGNDLTVQDVGPDDVLGFAAGQWAEVVDDTAERDSDAGHLVQIAAVDPGTRIITIAAPSSPLPAFDPARHPKLRRWDQTTGDESGIGIAAGPLDLEGGVQVAFSAGNYRSGDYWLIPARTAINTETGDIEWPRQPDGTPIAQPPAGIAHHYCPLALVQVAGGVFSLVADGDCRRPFPPLTDIQASDVGYDGSGCAGALGLATTVQQALDTLCGASGGTCTLAVHPGPGWEAVFANLPDHADAEICFPAGVFPLTRPLVIHGKGHLKLTGAGPGTRIVAAAETAIRFEQCASVLVRDLRAESGVAAERGDAQHLNGTLTFVDCAGVTVEDCTLKCAPGPVRAATCLTASYSAVPPHPLRPGAVRVRGCRLLIGHEQIGILLRDTGRVQIEDNVLQGNRAEQPNIGRLAENKRYRAALRHLLMSKVPAQPTAEQRARIVTVPGGDARVQFMTAAGITAQDWQALMQPLHPEHVGNSRDLFRLLKRAANQLILGNDLRVARLRAWREQMQTANHVAARTGIVIAGEVAREVRITHNSLRNVRRGIHVATSHADRTRRASVLAGRVTVTDNEIHLLAPLPALGPHVGIYAGNCGSLLIADNFVDARAPEVPDPTRLPLQGVRIFGFLGRVAIVRQNHLVGVPVGVFVHPLTGTRGLQNQWLVADNMAVSAQHAVVAEGPNGGLVRQDHNFS